MSILNGSGTWQRLGLGTWQLGGASQFGGRTNGWGALDDKAGSEIIAAALALGVRNFDTADAYGHGLSESRLGAVIGNRSDCCVITKFGQREILGQARIDFSANWLLEAVEGSLRRLRRERLDVLLLHSPPDDFDFYSYGKECLEGLKAQGKVGSYGVSVRTRIGAHNVIDAGFGDFIELIYNVLDRRATEIFALAQACGIKLIARSVLGSGWLARKSYQFAGDDQRSNMPAEASAWLKQQDHALSFLNDFPGGKTVSLLRFVLGNSSIACALLGVRNTSQLQALADSVELGPLDASACALIEQAVPEVYSGWQ